MIRRNLILFFALLCFAGCTLSSASYQRPMEPVSIALDEQASAKRLSKALTFATLSHQDPKQFVAEPFLELHAYLEQEFPLLYEAVEKQVIGDYSLLLKIPGSDPSLKPVLFMSHLDVVPVEPGTEDDWTYPAFSGEIADGFIWGRGALDVKNGVLTWHEAAEYLLKEGFQPQRSIYFAFGHDEEVGGERGNKEVVAYLKSRDIQLEFVVDEGGFLITGFYPELGDRPVAIISIAEKAYMTVHLTARGEGGHSSAPPTHTSVGKLATALHKLENNPMPADITEPLALHFKHVAPEMPFFKRLLMGNPHLSAPLLKSFLAKRPKTNALIRTTTALTMFHGGIKENVVPQTAKATVNFRLLPSNTPKQVEEHIRKTIDDPEITLETGLWTTPPKPADVNGLGYKVLADAIHEIYPTAVVTPFLVTGATDSRYYGEIADNVYRFLGAEVSMEDLKSFHGTNERISIKSYANGIRTAIRILKHSAQ